MRFSTHRTALPAALVHARLITTAIAAIALAATLARAEWPHDLRSPIQLAGGAFGNQLPEAALPDGAGGAFVVFQDDRAGNKDIYAQHLRGNGTVDPAWPASGRALCIAAGDQTGIQAISDGAGGFYVAWLDARSGVAKNYATRVLATGAIAPGFPVNGVLLDALRANAQHAAQICPDVSGGMVAVWEYDFGALDHDVYGAGISSTGTVLWNIGLATGGAMDVKPAVVLESSVCAMAWCQGTSTLAMMRFSASSGGIVGGVATASSITDPAIGPRITNDGWGGAFVVYSQKAGLNWTVAATRFYGGTAFTTYGDISPPSTSPIAIGDLVYAGAYTVWVTYGFPSLNLTYIQRIQRDGIGSIIATGVNGSAGQPMPLAGDGAGGVTNMHGLLPPTVTEEILMARRYTVSGAQPALWTAAAGLDGVPAMQLTRLCYPGAICSDGDGGAILIGYDAFLLPAQVRAIRLDRNGAFVGAPAITGIKDVANDQGGNVRVAWSASYLDREENPYVNEYRLWRQVPVAAAQALMKRGAPSYMAESSDAPPLGSIRFDESADAVFAWELAATQIANVFPAYSLTVPTVADSGAGGPANTVYMVEARSTGLNVGWASPPDSGRSVDNLPPATPSPFTGIAQAIISSTQLAWGANTESDLAGYELYRGATLGFVPGPSNLVVSTVNTSYLDGSMGSYYKLAAIDTHGNRSGYALVTPSGTLDTPGERAPRVLALALESANPASAGVVLRYELPASGRVTLRLYDVNGRVIRELLAGRPEAGRHIVRWDGSDASGAPAASGMYFARLTAPGGERVQRVVVSH